METSTLVSLGVLFVMYALIDYFYLKKHLGIKGNWKWMFSDERSKIAIMIDIVLVVTFMSIHFKMFIEPDSYRYPFEIQIIPLLTLAFLQSILQGFEEFLTNRSEKTYYRHWFSTVVIAGSYLIIYS